MENIDTGEQHSGRLLRRRRRRRSTRCVLSRPSAHRRTETKQFLRAMRRGRCHVTWRRGAEWIKRLEGRIHFSGGGLKHETCTGDGEKVREGGGRHGGGGVDGWVDGGGREETQRGGGNWKQTCDISDGHFLSSFQWKFA